MPAPPEAGDVITVAAAAGGSLAVFIGTIWSYIRKGKQASAGSEVAVVSATFADKKTIDRLSDAIEGQTKAQRDAADEDRRLRLAVEDCTEAVKASTDATVNMIRFITRERDS